MATLALALTVISALAFIIVIWRAVQESLMWGVFFFIGSPFVYYFLAQPLGPQLALAAVGAMHAYYVFTRWNRVGIPYVVAFVCFMAARFISPLPIF